MMSGSPAMRWKEYDTNNGSLGERRCWGQEMTVLPVSKVPLQGTASDLLCMALRGRWTLNSLHRGAELGLTERKPMVITIQGGWATSGSLLPVRFCKPKHKQIVIIGKVSWQTTSRLLAKSDSVRKALAAGGRDPLRFWVQVWVSGLLGN